MANHLKEIFKVIELISNEDCYLEQFLDEGIWEEILLSLCFKDLVWIAENDRVLLTPDGEQALFNYKLSVETNRKTHKL